MDSGWWDTLSSLHLLRATSSLWAVCLKCNWSEACAWPGKRPPWVRTQVWFQYSNGHLQNLSALAQGGDGRKCCAGQRLWVLAMTQPGTGGGDNVPGKSHHLKLRKSFSKELWVRRTKRQCLFSSRTMLPEMTICPGSSFTHQICIELNSVLGRVLGAKVSVSVQTRIVPCGARSLGTQLSLPLKTFPACPACVLQQPPLSWHCLIRRPPRGVHRISLAAPWARPVSARREPAVCRR